MNKKKPTTERYTLADLEKWDEIARDIDPPIRLGVFGDPVAHSLSPEMQNAALRACEIDAQYARFHIRPNELRSALRFLRNLDFVGVNLTVPHKIAGFAQIDEADEFASRGLVRLVDLRESRNFVWHGQVHSCEIQISQEPQSRPQFIRADMKTGILSVDLAGAQGGILHFRRKRMCDWITKNAQSNWRIDIARNITPLFKIGECVTLDGLHVFHVIPNGVRISRRQMEYSQFFV